MTENNEKKLSFEEVQKKNIETVRKDFVSAIDKFKPESAILIMAKHEQSKEDSKKYTYTTRIVKNIAPERIENFIRTLSAALVMLRAEFVKLKKLWISGQG